MNKIAFVFPGQGSQTIGMGQSLFNNYTVAKNAFEEANDVLGFDLKKLCFEGDMDELTKTENTQPALLTTAVAAFRVYTQEINLSPSFLAGHSLGEYCALTCCGAMQFADALRLVRKRGQFMQESAALGTGAMAAISGADKAFIEDTCKKISDEGLVVSVSCYNSLDQIVISGDKDGVSKAIEILTSKKARCMLLKVSAPFHSPLMKSAADKLAEELKKYTYKDTCTNVISNVTSKPYISNQEIIENLTLQMTQPVRWQESMQYLKDQEVTVAIEMGPQKVLKNLMKKNADSIATYCYEKLEDIQSAKKILVCTNENKSVEGYMKLISRSLAIAVCTKNSNWNNDEYKNGVLEPYRSVQQMYYQLEKEGKEPSVEQAKAAVRMLKSVFDTKKTPMQERTERFNTLFKETKTEHLFEEFIRE